MKAHRRQELKTNELAETLRQAREFLEKYGTYVAGGAVVVAVVLIGSLWWRRSLAAEQRRQWEDYYGVEQAAVQLVLGRPPDAQASGGADFDGLLDKYKTLVSSASAAQVKLRTLEALGDFCWQYAVRQENEEAKARALNESTAAYERILADFPDQARAAGNALLALAVIAEERGDFDRAEEIYRRIESDRTYEHTRLAEAAGEGLERLDDLREPIVFAPAPLEDEQAGESSPGLGAPVTVTPISEPLGMSTSGTGPEQESGASATAEGQASEAEEETSASEPAEQGPDPEEGRASPAEEAESPGR